jgi:hypothetical protein
MSNPISANITSATCRLTPGIVSSNATAAFQVKGSSDLSVIGVPSSVPSPAPAIMAHLANSCSVGGRVPLQSRCHPTLKFFLQAGLGAAQKGIG